MDNPSNDYRISFFKPTTVQSLYNRNMVVWLVSIWFVAIFGFQILLRVIEKPTPEKAYLTFQEVWGNVETGDPTTLELQQFGQATLSVLGKSVITPADHDLLSEALSYSVWKLTPEPLREELGKTVQEFETIRASISNITDPEYIAQKKSLSTKLSHLLALSPLDVRTTILPLALNESKLGQLSDLTAAKIPPVMEKYLIHNQSFLTDTKFLGFPFHYFYTAVFLLILFIGLCYLYCVNIDRLNKKMQINE